MSCKDLWSDLEANSFVTRYSKQGISEDLALRTYSARLLGADPNLVLHGGGNTSVKTTTNGIFNESISVLCVKGSGWDLKTIEPEGHPAVRLEPLNKLRDLSKLSDEDMVSIQRCNLINPSAPNPSVEALLHAFLPEKFVDHTHSIALLAIADQPNSEEICKEIYGSRVAIVPYVMPGFQLALAAAKAYEEAYEIAKRENVELEGMILLKHGLFSFGSSAKESYKRMIKLVQQAEELLEDFTPIDLNYKEEIGEDYKYQSIVMTSLRGLLGQAAAKHKIPKRWILDLRTSPLAIKLVENKDLARWATLGVATPDHVIRTKASPLVIKELPKSILDNETEFSLSLNSWLASVQEDLNLYIEQYINYFNRQNNNSGGNKKQLDPLPRLIAVPGLGLVGVGSSSKAAKIAADIGEAWTSTLIAAEKLGKFSPVNETEIFELEYWSLEQAKLGSSKEKKLSRCVVVVTGGGSGIGLATAKAFAKEGAEIAILDKNKSSAIESANNCGKNALAIECDLTSSLEVEKAFNEIAKKFGGIDIVVSNAGAAWTGKMSSIPEKRLRDSFELNFFAHQHVAKAAISIFRMQDLKSNTDRNYIGGQILFNVSKQALNPGDGFGAYGIAKAALLALMKQYSLEEGKSKIRCNAINADRIRSGLLNEEMIEERSDARGVSKEDYMGGNLIREEVRAIDVAKAFVALSLMERTTGAVLTVDGGNVAAMVR